MTYFILISLLVIGLLLLLTEILFVPGTTIVGIIGGLISAGGIYYAFLALENRTAWLVVALTLLVNFSTLLLGFRSGAWKKFALKEAITSRVFDDRLEGLTVNQEGKATSDIKPIGKAEFKDQIYEVKSETGFIRVGSTVIITKLENNTIIVKS